MVFLKLILNNYLAERAELFQALDLIVTKQIGPQCLTSMAVSCSIYESSDCFMRKFSHCKMCNSLCEKGIAHSLFICAFGFGAFAVATRCSGCRSCTLAGRKIQMHTYTLCAFDIFCLQLCNQLQGNHPTAEAELKVYFILDCLNMVFSTSVDRHLKMPSW